MVLPPVRDDRGSEVSGGEQRHPSEFGDRHEQALDGSMWSPDLKPREPLEQRNTGQSIEDPGFARVDNMCEYGVLQPESISTAIGARKHFLVDPCVIHSKKHLIGAERATDVRFLAGCGLGIWQCGQARLHTSVV